MCQGHRRPGEFDNILKFYTWFLIGVLILLAYRCSSGTMDCPSEVRDRRAAKAIGGGAGE